MVTVSRDNPRDVSAPDDLATAGSLSAFVHGILFDRDRLSADAGPSARDRSDSALVLAACARRGQAALASLRGSFVAVLVDRESGRVTVARDPLGMHPLFYTVTDRAVIFASAPDRLLAHAGVRPVPNRLAIADHLCFRWPQPDETFFRDVKRVLPGSWAVVTSAGLRVERYWDPAPTDRPIDWLSDAETDRFDERLAQAVNRGLSLGRSAIFLSGGLDSISVAAVASDEARRATRPAPSALSLLFPDPECDERRVQAEVARSLGLSYRHLDFQDAVGPRGLLAGSLELNRGLASPLLNTWGPAYLSLARLGSEHGVRTILTGQGGDEWLSVSPFLAADLMWRGDVKNLMSFLGVWRRSYRHSLPQVLRNGLWRFGARPLAGRLIHRAAPHWWERSRSRRAVAGDPEWILPDRELRAAQRARVSSMLSTADPPGGFYLREVRLGILNSLTSWELEEQHEFGRRAGVTFLNPYWDADLVDLLYRIPPHRLMRRGRTKDLVRETLARRFPGLGFEYQRKVAATSYYLSRLREEGPVEAARLGGFDGLASLGVVEPGRARLFLRGAFGRSGRDPHQAWQLLNLESWVRQYVN